MKLTLGVFIFLNTIFIKKNLNSIFLFKVLLKVFNREFYYFILTCVHCFIISSCLVPKPDEIFRLHCSKMSSCRCHMSDATEIFILSGAGNKIHIFIFCREFLSACLTKFYHLKITAMK